MANPVTIIPLSVRLAVLFWLSDVRRTISILSPAQEQCSPTFAIASGPERKKGHAVASCHTGSARPGAAQPERGRPRSVVGLAGAAGPPAHAGAANTPSPAPPSRTAD